MKIAKLTLLRHVLLQSNVFRVERLYFANQSELTTKTLFEWESQQERGQENLNHFIRNIMYSRTSTAQHSIMGRHASSPTLFPGFIVKDANNNVNYLPSALGFFTAAVIKTFLYLRTMNSCVFECFMKAKNILHKKIKLKSNTKTRTCNWVACTLLVSTRQLTKSE